MSTWCNIFQYKCELPYLKWHVYPKRPPSIRTLTHKNVLLQNDKGTISHIKWHTMILSQSGVYGSKNQIIISAKSNEHMETIHLVPLILGMTWKVATQIKKWPTPLCSLWKFMKSDYKHDPFLSQSILGLIKSKRFPAYSCIKVPSSTFYL